MRALCGKKIKVNGYMTPLQNGAKRTHSVLLAYPLSWVRVKPRSADASPILAAISDPT